MNQEHLLAILYELALLTGTETRSVALIEKMLGRLMYHVGFPCGLFFSFCADAGGNARSAETESVRLEAAVGNDSVLSRLGQELQLPRALVAGGAALFEEGDLIRSTFPCTDYSIGLRLPVPEQGVFLLLSRTRPETALPLTTLFEPVLNNLATAIRLCRQNEQYTARLEEEIGRNRQITDALLESQTFLYLVLDNIPARVFWKDRNSAYLGCNRAFMEDAGLSSTAEIVGKSDDEMPWYEQADLYRADDRRVVEARQAKLNYEELQTRQDGTVGWLQTSKVPLIAASGDLVGVLGIYEDITHRKKSEEALVRQKEVAEAANRAKSEFLSRMSHELRTPLNAILGFGQFLESDTAEPLTASQQDCVDYIIKAGWHLLSLINEVLDLAKVEEGRVDLQVETVDLLELIDECMALVSPLAAERPVELRQMRTQAMAARVRADRTRLKQVILNLLSNAIQYNRENGTVTVSTVLRSDGRTAISIADTGPGMTEDQLRQIFEPFTRFADDTERKGTGIGLTISKRLVEMMGGSIEVLSTVGVGSEFTIVMPSNEQLVTSAKSIAPASTAPECTENAPAGTVLYVEDNPANIELVQLLFARRPEVRLLVANTPQIGLELAVAHAPDVILMDINLPGYDGYQLKEILQDRNETRQIPVIALTASAMPADVERGRRAGFLEYVTKPIDAARLMLIIDEVLGARGRMSSDKG